MLVFKRNARGVYAVLLGFASLAKVKAVDMSTQNFSQKQVGS
jgi:hypothetical protein